MITLTLDNRYDAARLIKEMADLETGKDQPEPHALPAINVSFVYPPIPDRRSDYCATRDGYEGGDPIGYGATEQAAIEDLKQQIEEAA